MDKADKNGLIFLVPAILLAAGIILFIWVPISDLVAGLFIGGIIVFAFTWWKWIYPKLKIK